MSAPGYLGTFEINPQVKILLLNPVAAADGAEGPRPLEVDCGLSPGTRIDEVYCAGAPVSIDDSRAARSVAGVVVEKCRWAEAEGYDAVLLNCMLDPGLIEARHAVAMPVIGLRDATTSMALLVGSEPGYFDPDGIKVADYATDANRTYARLVECGRNKVNFQGADVLVPNCTYLGGLAGRLQADLGVPVLANRDVALRVVELLVQFRLRAEEPWVAGQRSRMKILLSKIYAVPVLGAAVYAVMQFLRRLFRDTSRSR